MMGMLRISDISFNIGKKEILKNIDASFLPGKMNMILGPNGSGKSTLLKIFSGEIRHYDGTVKYSEQNLQDIPVTELAKIRAVMSQQPHLQFPLRVREVVMMGRYPHFQFSPGEKDEKICDEVLEKLHLQTFQNRNYLTLSGGEKQRVQYARVLSQIWDEGSQNKYLFLDEPLNSLDIKFQQEFLEIARQFVNEQTVFIAIMHDINLALRYADEIFFMKEGRLIRQGPATIVNEELISEIFGIDSTIINHNNRPLVVLH
jgi:iron complex transport system ATP-binding protein